MTDYKEIASYIIILAVVLIVAQHLNVVVSGSMEPAFYRGDIVVYNAKWFNQPVIHRIIDSKEINGTTVYEIKGDNNNRSDPYYVTADQIQARVLKWGDNPVVIPKVGYLSLWLRGL